MVAHPAVGPVGCSVRRRCSRGSRPPFPRLPWKATRALMPLRSRGTLPRAGDEGFGFAAQGIHHGLGHVAVSFQSSTGRCRGNGGTDVSGTAAVGGSHGLHGLFGNAHGGTPPAGMDGAHGRGAPGQRDKMGVQSAPKATSATPGASVICPSQTVGVSRKSPSPRFSG